jgi:hypothetical protein
MFDRATAAESTAALKSALRARWPQTGFSVRGGRGTAYGWCSVSWTDGPTEALVDEVTGDFQGEGFDGSTDSTYSLPGRLPDGRRTGLRGINTSRHLSPAFTARVIAAVAAYVGADPHGYVPTVEDYQSGRAGNTSPVGWQTSWQELIWRAAGDRQTVVRDHPAPPEEPRPDVVREATERLEAWG